MTAPIVMLTIGLRPNTDLVALRPATAMASCARVAIALGPDSDAPVLSARSEDWPDVYRRLGEALTSAGVDLTAVTP